MTELSIIIPIYNTPLPELKRCFNSIVPPAGAKWEVLCVDDGSQAAVGEFCKEYASQRPMFRYIPKENGGVSAARNLGIDHATGKYLMFVDADDCLLPQALTDLQNLDADLIFFDIQLTQLGKDSAWNSFPLSPGSLTREQVLDRLCTSASISGPWGKLFKTSKLESIRFDPCFITGEDWMFVCDFTLQAESFYYSKACAYRYFRAQATSQGRLLRAPETMLKNLTDRHARKQQVIAQLGLTQAAAPAAAELIENLFNSAAILRTNKALTPERRSFIRQHAELAAADLTHGHAKTRMKLWVLRSCPVALYPIAILRKLYLKFKY